MELEIYCPRCAWEPAATSRWGCSCGHSWNTFDTGGRCPRCHHQWHDTQCLSCARWSPHLDWYHDDHGLVETLLAETTVPAARPQAGARPPGAAACWRPGRWLTCLVEKKTAQTAIF